LWKCGQSQVSKGEEGGGGGWHLSKNFEDSENTPFHGINLWEI